MMNFFHRYLLLVAVLFLALPVALFAQADKDFPPKPDPLQPVNDFAHVLSSAEVSQLSEKLRQYDQESSTTIIIVTVPSIGGYEIAQYATELGNRWGIGRKGKDNGVVILAAIGERKVNISVGRGLEGVLTDLKSGQIIRREIVPAFKQADYYEGFSRAADAVIKVTKGEYTNDDPQEGRDEGVSVGAIVLLFIIVFVMMRFMRGGGGNSGRGGGGGWIPPIIIGGGGFGGGGSSGWGGGGGFGGGGFGGGGGGSFGGGGASGSW